MFFQASYFFVNRRVILALRNSTTTNTSTKATAQQQQQQQQQRKKKSVRFSGVDNVCYTHSPSEYDRSYQLQQKQAAMMRPRTVVIQTPPHRFTPSTPTMMTATNTSAPITMKKPKNKLRINTQLDTAGPLFFTQLSTNYGRHCKPSNNEQNILLAAC
ncbi:hypothetical protein BDC45DRAFT_492993 [Circinella umbellata]|nr:hypothetical protein BDC45DRAFT_492993 [Circinella umbellata]